jgi:hypothetical protein
MKVTFASNFEARTFLNRFEENKSNENVTSVWTRPYRTKEDQMQYSKNKKQVKELNDAAKEAGNDTRCSYSLRNNGVIWKFVKADGKWRRDENWTPEKQTQGND